MLSGYREPFLFFVPGARWMAWPTRITSGLPVTGLAIHVFMLIGAFHVALRAKSHISFVAQCHERVHTRRPTRWYEAGE